MAVAETKKAREFLERLERRIDALEKRVASLEDAWADFKDILRDFVLAFKDLVNALKPLVQSFEGLDAKINRIESTLRDFRHDMDILKKGINSLKGDIKRLDGVLVERNYADFLENWFARFAPDVKILRWFQTGCDIILEFRDAIIPVELATVPTKEDVDQVVAAKGVIKENWGVEPAAMVVLSMSRKFEEGLEEYANAKGVKLAKSPKELLNILVESTKTN